MAEFLKSIYAYKITKHPTPSFPTGRLQPPCLPRAADVTRGVAAGDGAEGARVPGS